MNELVLELVEEYRERRRQGRSDTPEDVCAGHPELLPEVKRAIRKVERMERRLRPEEESPLPSPAPRALPACDDVGRWPTIPGFEILARLGGGGMGEVFKAREEDTGLLVALKLPRLLSPGAFDQFKNEFRIMQNVSHPNLVTLYDAAFTGPQPYFTMEFVEGRPFFPYPGSTLALDGDRSTENLSVSRQDIVEGSAGIAPVSPFLHAPAVTGELRASLGSLARGIQALHERGIFHRDIKPSNVHVTPQGRVVLLDFGLAREAVPDERSATHQGLAGTLPYMAPEQAEGRFDRASDWYGFGVMLYEALTGRHPFRGTAREMPWRRTQYAPPPPHATYANVPEDLSRLCADLLCPSPASRPSGPEVLRRLGEEKILVKEAPTVAEPLFLGRAHHLACLHDALDEVRGGRTLTVLVHGPSGVGKTALVQHFLERVRQQDRSVVVLTGRCYERESVSYKALDGLVDALSRFWRHLPGEQAPSLLPADVGPLVRIFPVLQRVETVAAAPRRGPDSPDPHEVRRRAFLGLREVLARVGDRWTLVVHLDDLQWGDVDSALMLTGLLLPPAPPRLLLLAGFRSEGRDTSAFLQTFLQPPGAGPAMDRRELPVQVLAFEEARDLAVRLLGAEGTQDTALPEAVARESCGIPFFLQELVEAVRAGNPRVTLGEVLEARTRALPEEKRNLLEVVAVAGRPLRTSVALRAANLGENGRTLLIDLQTTRLLRGSPGEQHEVETFHDRIREAVVGRMTLEVQTHHHQRLALALEVWGKADPEVLAFHQQRAGNREKARLNYVEAADRAARALAFDRAAGLYHRALELESSTEEARRLRCKLGDALANAGRGPEAARAYLAAAEGAPAPERAELQRKTAIQYVRSGHMKEGLAALDAVLKGVRLKLPTTQRRALLSVLLQRLWLKLRGLGFRERPASEIPAEELQRIDVAWSAAQLTLSDPIRGLDLHHRQLLLALRAGEPGRVARALAAEICYPAMAGRRRADEQIRHLTQQATALADRINEPYYHAVIDMHAGGAALLLGRWKESQLLSDRAERVFRERCTGVAWELATARHFSLYSLTALGEWRECARRLPALLKEAQERGDHYALTSLLVHQAFVCLGEDRPENAAEVVNQASGLCEQHGYRLQQYHAALGEVITALYRGERRLALQIVHERWRAIKGSLLLHVQEVYLALLQLRAQASIAVARDTGPSERAYLLKSAERDIRRVERADMPWANAMTALLRANLAACRGRLDEAVIFLTEAERRSATVEMGHHVAMVRRRRGQILGGAEGRSLMASADAWMAGQDIKNPALLTATYTVGFRD